MTFVKKGKSCLLYLTLALFSLMGEMRKSSDQHCGQKSESRIRLWWGESWGMIEEKLYDSRKHQGFCHMLWQAYPVYFILYIIEREMTRRWEEIYFWILVEDDKLKSLITNLEMTYIYRICQGMMRNIVNILHVHVSYYLSKALDSLLKETDFIFVLLTCLFLWNCT